MEVMATSKWVRTSAQKVRLVTRSIEGMPVDEALTILRFTPRAAARDVAKVVTSAVANAEHNYDLDRSVLRVARIDVNGAGILKRIRAGSRGHVGSKFRRSAHMTAVVATSDDYDRRIAKARVTAAENAAAPVVEEAPSTKSSAEKKKTTPQSEATSTSKETKVTSAENKVEAPKAKATAETHVEAPKAKATAETHVEAPKAKAKAETSDKPHTHGAAEASDETKGHTKKSSDAAEPSTGESE